MTNNQIKILDKYKEAGARFGGYMIDAEGNMVIIIYDKAITMNDLKPIIYRYIYDQDGKLVNALPVIYNVNS